jgi:protein disulfide-isomerase A6
LRGIIKVGAVDLDAEPSVGSPYNVKGFPTLKFFGDNKGSPLDYEGARSAQAIVSYALQQAKAIADRRLNGKAGGSSSSGKGGQKQDNKYFTDKDVIVLEDSNFESVVMSSKDMWLIEFYAPWCGHCKKLEPEWNQAASELKGKVKVAKVDATVHQRIAGKYGVRGYPTIKIFAAGAKSDNSVESYEGPREASGIVGFALDKLEKYGVVPDVEQITSAKSFEETCVDRVGVCIIAYLPHILDSSANERNNYLDIIKEASKSSRGKQIYYLWAQGGDYYDFEQKLNLSFGYPAIVAVSHGKKKYAIFRNSFQSQNVKTFVNS